MTIDGGQRNQGSDMTLVDLAVIFLRNRWVFYIVFALCTSIGLGYALVSEDRYQYVSLFQSAVDGANDSALVEPSTVIASLESQWLPEVASEYRSAEGEKMPFEISFSNPNETVLVRIVTEASESDSPRVKAVHQQLIDKMKPGQIQKMKRKRESFSQELKSIDQLIARLESGQGAGEALANAVERRLEIQSQLEQLMEAEVLTVARESAEKVGPRRAIIVVVSALLGAIVGFFLAFFSEFVRMVRSEVVV